jgi:hypothetical protein
VVGANQTPSSGEEVYVTLPTGALHFFDSASGARIDR